MGCATATKQTDELLNTPPTELPRASVIPNVPFVEQSVGYCGPATLTMVMNWNGKNISVDDLAKQVYTPGMKGSFQADMISASRRNAMMAVQIEGLNELLHEVSAGHPVIIFENLALKWAPQYHYAVVYGYDLDRQEIIMHSGPEKAKRWGLRKFERSWVLGDYWGLVILPPGQLAAAGSELSHVIAAAGLEQIAKNDEAEKSYLAILKRWPKSLGALIGMGNISFAKKEYKKSADYLRAAVQNHPESAAGWHNLAIATYKSGLKNKARVSAKKALELVSSEERKAYILDFSAIKLF